ncbi:MAG TPA: lactate utilization protein [Terriglobales bacterium]|nr:lactate utilization protein [Terriglobales bacterium]
MTRTKIFETFKARAESVSAEVHHFARKGEALDFILEFLGKEAVNNDAPFLALWAACPFLKGLDKSLLADKVPNLSFDVTRDRAANARVGISQMDWALANTGTLAQDATSVAKRLVSTLPNIHIAIVQSSEIVPDLPTLLTKADPERAAYISLITGPSRTADIERVLTIGVHGPERLIIVAVDESEETN